MLIHRQGGVARHLTMHEKHDFNPIFSPDGKSIAFSSNRYGNDDVFALNARTGEMLWERWSGIDQKISTICYGWVNRGLAMGEEMLFLGQLDTNVVALNIKTGKEVWKTPIEDWHNGYVVTSAPLYTTASFTAASPAVSSAYGAV